ncbi:integrin alpha-M-like [Heptranchias perlo]|uniref:integrin alpha-M-like n=1 Tax=Heptranchias perlo TaxID=212740 RepID=UPI00355A5088
MSINATSENPRRITNESSFTRTLRLRYAIHLAASGLGYTRNVNFTAGRHETRLVKHSYQVENLSWRSLPISVAFTVPVKVGARSLWNVTVSERKPGNRSVCQPAVETTPSVKREAPKDRPDHAVLDCGIVLCVMLRCSVGLLEDHGAVIFDVQGELKSPAVSELNLKKMGLPSKVLVSYDEVKYVDLSEGADRYKEATLVTEVEILDRVKWLPLILGSSVGGLILLLIMMVLLYKLGFFKRNFDSGDGDAPEAKTSEGGESPEGEEEAASE